MAQCDGIKRAGGRCEVVLSGLKTHCYHHDPAQAEKRKRVASKGGRRGGRGRPQAELADIKRRLLELTDAVLDGSVNRASAAVAGQLINTLLRAVAVELRVREQEDLTERLEELEAALSRQKERGGYGSQR
jgi:hypothetical protein